MITYTGWCQYNALDGAPAEPRWRTCPFSSIVFVSSEFSLPYRCGASTHRWVPILPKRFRSQFSCSDVQMFRLHYQSLFMMTKYNMYMWNTRDLFVICSIQTSWCAQWAHHDFCIEQTRRDQRRNGQRRNYSITRYYQYLWQYIK